MKKILKKIKNKKNRKARFVCSLSIKLNSKIMVTTVGIINGNISFKILGTKDLDTIQSSFQMDQS